mmetsp:Transcript_22712/g.63858  ORF Transcript_22712/g.63858 Transcript_22712/m.63858 type:complete len:200 (-) Transcript_22712:146-745(-)
MKLYTLMIFNKPAEDARPAVVSSAEMLGDFMFYERGSVRELTRFVSREVVQRSPKGERNSVMHKGHLCHAYVRGDGLAMAAISDEEYPPRVAFSLIHEMMEQFTLKEFPWKAATEDHEFAFSVLQEYIEKFQDPTEADKLMKIQKDIDQTRETVIMTIDQLLQRGEKLDALAARSDDLSFQSKVFVDKSKEMNSCCTIL